MLFLEPLWGRNTKFSPFQTTQVMFRSTLGVAFCFFGVPARRSSCKLKPWIRVILSWTCYHGYSLPVFPDYRHVQWRKQQTASVVHSRFIRHISYYQLLLHITFHNVNSCSRYIFTKRRSGFHPLVPIRSKLIDCELLWTELGQI